MENNETCTPCTTKMTEEQKKYEVSMNKLIALVGGKANLYPQRRAELSVTEKVVAELLAEEKEEFEKKLKANIKKLLTTNIETEKAINEKQKELDDLKKKKQKEFVDEANRLFNSIDDWAKIETRYSDSLKSAGEAVSGEKPAQNDPATGPGSVSPAGAP